MEDEARASEARFVEYVESLAEVLGYVDRAGPLKDYCTGLLLPGERKSVEADRVDRGSVARLGGTSVAAAFRRAVGLVGRKRVGQGARARRAGDGDAGPDRGLDCRRHGLREEGRAFGGRGATILRTAR